jgi:Domain of unknown function (DUF4124)
MRFVVASAILLFAVPAAADLYRWVDPETGSTKFSSYPPPWYGDPAKQRRAPRVEVIPAGKGSTAVVEESDGAPVVDSLQELASRRKTMLQQLSVLSAQTGPERGQALAKQLEGFAALTDQMDKLDPKGAAARNAETQAVVEKIIKGAPR